MTVSEDMIKKIIELARIDLTEDEVREFTKQIDDVLEAFKTLEKVDTENIPPSFQPLELKNVWREDQVCEWDWNPLGNTENREGKYFKGPRAV